MKVCTRCGKDKPETEFWFRDNSKRRLRSECKSCVGQYHSVYIKKHYLQHRDYYLRRVKARRMALKTEARQRMLEYLQGKSCEECGEADVRTFEFDHLDPSLKSFSVAHGIAAALTWDAILAEIQKCRMLCANCHRKHTAEQFGWYRQTP
jgi:hypothetical protein